MKNPVWIYRLTHYRNLPFILQHGLHCPNSPTQDEAFGQIGFTTLIDQRRNWPVPVAPGGTLSDYIPFYFCIKSPMLYVIYRGNDPEVVGQQDEIIYLVSTVERIREMRIPFVFTDRHARLAYANFYNDQAELPNLNWNVIHTADWGRQYGEDRKEIKQAEFLIHRHLPAEALLGIGCKNPEIREQVSTMLAEADVNILAKIKENWYY